MRNRIRELRERSNLTQREVAVLLGVDESDISRWEACKRTLTPATVEKLAAIFKVSTWELFLDRKGLRRLMADTDVMPESERETKGTASMVPCDRDPEKGHDSI